MTLEKHKAMEYQNNSGTSPESNGHSTSSIPVKISSRPRRPCDACRKRKSRCELQDGDSICVLCKFHHQPCLFNENPQPRKRRKVSGDGTGENKIGTNQRDGSISSAFPLPLDQSADASFISVHQERRPIVSIRQEPRIDDYANLKGPTLLKKTLGLQNHRHSRFLGSTSEFEATLLSLPNFAPKEELNAGPISVRKVTPTDCFLLLPDSGTTSHVDELRDLDAIESIVAPHGKELIHLYFRIIHPSFPILHKKVFLEKYERTHREFSPPLLAAVYILALNWWSYSAELSLLTKPDTEKLETLALRTMSYIVSRPKLSTIQAGLLLLQRPEGDSWALTSKLVALGQDLGLHLDCSKWRIPAWEKGLRKRLAWALYLQDKWGALVHGRPSHITMDDWMVKTVTEADFPEKKADEDDEEGSTEVEKGRVLFCEMIRLTEILTTILSEFYTLKAEEDFRERAQEGGIWVLERAKPIQLRLKDWFMNLPECLKMENVKMRKLNSTGYLHLAYYTAEITLHRRIIRSLAHESNIALVNICRSAARARLISGIDFVKSLRPEHLQSFWYSASKYSFAVVGTFISLLWATALTKEEGEDYRGKLEEYRWTLRLSSKSAEILDRAISMLTTSTCMLVKSIPEKKSAETDDGSRTTAPSPTGEERDGSEDWSVDRSMTDGYSAWQAYPVDQNSYSMAHNFHHSVDGMDHFLEIENGMHQYPEPEPLTTAAFDMTPDEYVKPR